MPVENGQTKLVLRVPVTVFGAVGQGVPMARWDPILLEWVPFSRNAP